MSKVFKERYTATIEGDFVVFLIGMRINQPWRFWEWWPVLMAMAPMLRELYEHPELGFLGTEYFLSFGNRAPMLVQYWKSFEHLEAYARGKDHAHLPAWRNFNRKAAKSGSVGIFHETYVVAAGKTESVYANMPRFGLARAAGHVLATGKRETARQRLTG
jgi:hypothetical protein